MSEDATHNVARAGDRYTSDSMICSTCRGLLIRPHETVEENTPAPYDFKTIVQSASGGCPICEMFYSDLMRDDSPELLSLKGSVAFSFRYGLEDRLSKDQMVADHIQLHTNKDNGPCRLYIPLLSALSYGSNSQGQNDASPSPKAFPVRTPIEAKNTGDKRCLEMAASWLRTCMRDHKDCSTNLGLAHSVVLPTRVIDTSGGTIQLVSNVEGTAEQSPSYMTVSHKWMSSGMTKLLRCNLGEMQQGIHTQSLPAVFRDAVSLARALEIRYVWIDALCIVQDDPDELQHEISNMGHIYRNAVLNVGALQAAEAEPTAEQESMGLFLDRNTQDISPFALTIQRGDYKRDHFAYQDLVLEKLNWSSLMKRGWVLQERLLSRRSIYFGDRLWWECSEQLACERFPSHLPVFSKIGSWLGKETPYRVTNLLSRSVVDKGLYERICFSKWDTLVSTFSECHLSFEQDCLVALSGLAHEFQNILDDEYYAGLWGKNICNGLLWHRNTSYYDDDDARPKQYRAPSWSWASFNGRICSTLSHEPQPEIIAEVLEVSTTPVGSDPTGRISDGYIRISGHLRPSQRSLSKKYTRHIQTWWIDRLSVQYEWFEEGYTVDGHRPMHSCFFLLLAHGKTTERMKFDEYFSTKTGAKGRPNIEGDSRVEIGYVYGLILEAVNLESSIYRRIGAFKHMWGNGRTSVNNPRPEDYPEFLDFDANNFERHTVTII